MLDEASDHDDPYHRAAALLWRLANANVFEDGNKRTAWVLAKTHLLQRGFDVEPAGEPAATVMKHFKRYDTAELVA